MAGLIDTNILLYAVNTDSRHHAKALTFLSTSLATGDSWYLTEGIAYEFLRVATHSKVFSAPLTWQQAVEFLESLWSRPNVVVLTAGLDHWKTLKSTLPGIRYPAGNLFFDIRSLVLMQEHGIRTVYTADTDFLQFDGISVINPVAEIG